MLKKKQPKTHLCISIPTRFTRCTEVLFGAALPPTRSLTVRMHHKQDIILSRMYSKLCGLKFQRNTPITAHDSVGFEEPASYPPLLCVFQLAAQTFLNNLFFTGPALLNFNLITAVAQIGLMLRLFQGFTAPEFELHSTACRPRSPP